MSSTRDSSESSSRELLEPLRPDDSKLVYRDELTDLYNRRLLTEMFTVWWDDLIARCGEFSLIMMDLDLFKEVNDRYGHLSGDQVLRITGTLLRENFRKGDFVFRYGGDEFLVLLPGAGREEAKSLAARARRAMHEYEFLTHEEEKRIDVPLTFSIGIASYPDDGATPEELISHADALLYDEKRQLRDRSGARRKLILQTVAALALASIPLLILIDWDDVIGLRPVEAPVEITEPVEVEALSAERLLLLEQIETLERRIEQLQESAPATATVNDEAETPEQSGEIEALRDKIEQLNRQLEVERLAAEPTDRAVPEPVPSTKEVAPPVAADRPRVEPTPLRAPPPRDRTPPERQPVDVTAPSLKVPVDPRYPPIARRLGKEATVELIVRVGENGRVIHARAVGPRAGFGFEEAAINAALRSSWNPGRRNGKPVEMETGLRITFQIPD